METPRVLHPKSTLYITFRVVQLVNHLRKRLKPRVLSTKAKDPELAKQVATSFARDATKGISQLFARNTKFRHRVNKQRNGIRDVPAVVRAKSEYARSKLEVKKSLEELSEAVGERIGFDVVHTAQDDRQFLRKDVRPVFDHLSWLQAAQNIHLINAALDILALLRSVNGNQALSLDAKASQWLVDEKTCANLEHLLLCVRESLMHTFIAKVLESVVASAEWQNHWRRQLKFGGDKWCAEFSNNQRPISTTWPWSIRPSLAVLWGVCWMFYPQAQDAAADAYNSNWWQNWSPALPQNLGNVATSQGESQSLQPGYNVAMVGPSATQSQAEAVNVGANVSFWQSPGGDVGGSLRARPAQPPETAGQNRAVFLPPGPCPRLSSPQPWSRGIENSSGSKSLPRHLINSLGSTQLHPPASSIEVASTFCLPGTYQGPYQVPVASEAAVRPRNQYNRPCDASTRAFCFPPELPGLVTSAKGDFVNFERGHVPALRPQTAITTGNPFSPVFGHQTQPFQLTLNTIGVTRLQAPTQPQRQRSSVSSSSASPINTELVQPQDLPAFLTPNSNTHITYSGYQYYLDTMATDLTNTTDPALTAGDHTDLKPQDAVELAVNATNHGLADPTVHGDMSEDPDSPDGIEPFSPRRGFTHKRNEEAPRNEAGKMICKFQATCAGLTFDRRCEWSKHMDKHERPYKCNAPGCEKLQGFTYSGGLLRHQREVHKMHGGTKKALYCPEPNCKRNSGTGFTRKENLSEHIRRVHRRATDSVVPYTDGTGIAPVARMHPDAIEQLEAATREEPDVNDVTDPALTAPINNKRKHDDLEVHENGLEGSNELKEEVKRLKADIDARDTRLKTLEDEFRKQTELLQQILSQKASV